MRLKNVTLQTGGISQRVETIELDSKRSIRASNGTVWPISSALETQMMPIGRRSVLPLAALVVATPVVVAGPKAVLSAVPAFEAMPEGQFRSFVQIVVFAIFFGAAMLIYSRLDRGWSLQVADEGWQLSISGAPRTRLTSFMNELRASI